MAPVPAIPLVTVALCLSLAPPSASTGGSGGEPSVGEPPVQTGRILSEEDLRKAWRRLDDEERYELMEWFRLECSQRDTFQLRLLRREMRILEVDPGLLHEAVPPSYFDPEEHAPKAVKKRKWLEASSSKVERLEKKLFGDPDPRRIRSGFFYDWGTGQLHRATPLTDEEIFEHGLLGYPPDTDIVRALVLAKLDTGEERDSLAAFGRAYTDRKGNAYPTVTLYDAWDSGERFETPDVDTLGIVHVALDDWTSWKAPVKSSQQKELYRTIEDVFTRARRYRALREVLADLFIVANPAPIRGYGPHHDRLHSLWEDNESDPERLARLLPDAEDWDSFLSDWFQLVDRDAGLRRKGNGRGRLLGQNHNVVREALGTVFLKFGAIDPPRRSTPRGSR